MNDAHPTPPPERKLHLVAPVACRQVAESRRMILRAAELAAPGRVAVLGAGRCAEIPLAELAARFEQVTLNDLERDPVEAAVAQLEPALRAKLHVEIADLTGQTEPLVEAMRQRLNRCNEPATALDAMSEALDTAAPGMFPLPGRYDFVVASGLISQLHFALTQGARGLFCQRFSDREQEFDASTRWKTAVERLARTMEARFVDALEGLASGGVIYASDSIRVAFVEGTASGQWRTEGTYRMTQTTDLMDYFDARFTLVGRAHWDWVVSPPIAPGEVGRVFDVQGCVLRVSP